MSKDFFHGEILLEFNLAQFQDVFKEKVFIFTLLGDEAGNGLAGLGTDTQSVKASNLEFANVSTFFFAVKDGLGFGKAVLSECLCHVFKILDFEHSATEKRKTFVFLFWRLGTALAMLQACQGDKMGYSIQGTLVG